MTQWDDSTRQMLKSTIEHVFLALVPNTHGNAPNDSPLHANSKTTTLRLISSLAEGADRVAARAALEAQLEIQCPLPFHCEEYEKEFESENSRLEFREFIGRAGAVLELDGDREASHIAYLEAGRVMLEQSDILIAVWDGKPQESVGSTAQIVTEALVAGKMVLRIAPEKPGQINVMGRSAELPWAEASRQEVERLTGLQAKPAEVLQRYLSEHEVRVNWGWLFTVFRNLVCEKSLSGGGFTTPSYVKDTEAQWDTDWKQHSRLPDSVETQINQAFRDHYARADHLAILYAGLFRSAYVARYVLVALAIFATLFGSFAVEYKWAGFFAQLFFLMCVIVLIRVENKRHWHSRSLEYRMLAEQLRMQRFLFPLGRSSCPREDKVHARETPAWIASHMRSIIRQAGLVSATVDPQYIQALRDYLIGAEIENQIVYHNGTFKWQNRLQRRLHRWAMVFFFLGVLAFAGRVAAYKVWPSVSNGQNQVENAEPAYIKSLLTSINLCVIIFPALGAMFNGIRSHGEFQRLSARSKAMHLLHVNTRARLLSRGSMSWWESGNIVNHLAEQMLLEVTDWRVVVEGRGLSLPI